MRRVASPAEKATWFKVFRRHLIGFVSCSRSTEGITHWCAAERHWNRGTVYTRLCDLIGSWGPAPHRTVDCMTCLIRINNLFVEEST